MKPMRAILWAAAGPAMPFGAASAGERWVPAFEVRSWAESDTIWCMNPLKTGGCDGLMALWRPVRGGGFELVAAKVLDDAGSLFTVTQPFAIEGDRQCDTVDRPLRQHRQGRGAGPPGREAPLVDRPAGRGRQALLHGVLARPGDRPRAPAAMGRRRRARQRGRGGPARDLPRIRTLRRPLDRRPPTHGPTNPDELRAAADLAGTADVIAVEDGHALLRVASLTRGKPRRHPVVRLFEDLLGLWPVVAEPVPDDVVARLSAWRDAGGRGGRDVDDPRSLHLWEDATGWWRRRRLASVT